METVQDKAQEFVIRFVGVAGVSIALGIAIFGRRVFVITAAPFQFVQSGVTAGLFYASLKNLTSIKNSIAALFVWYVLLLTLLVKFNTWLPILDLAYLGGIAAAIYLCKYVVDKGLIHGIVQRLATSIVFLGLANVLIIVLLSTIQFIFYHHARQVSIFFSELPLRIRANLIIGCAIGFGAGVGIEIVEYYFDRRHRQDEAVTTGGPIVRCASCRQESSWKKLK